MTSYRSVTRRSYGAIGRAGHKPQRCSGFGAPGGLRHSATSVAVAASVAAARRTVALSGDGRKKLQHWPVRSRRAASPHKAVWAPPLSLWSLGLPGSLRRMAKRETRSLNSKTLGPTLALRARADRQRGNTSLTHCSSITTVGFVTIKTCHGTHHSTVHCGPTANPPLYF